MDYDAILMQGPGKGRHLGILYQNVEEYHGAIYYAISRAVLEGARIQYYVAEEKRASVEEMVARRFPQNPPSIQFFTLDRLSEQLEPDLAALLRLKPGSRLFLVVDYHAGLEGVEEHPDTLQQEGILDRLAESIPATVICLYSRAARPLKMLYSAVCAHSRLLTAAGEGKNPRYLSPAVLADGDPERKTSCKLEDALHRAEVEAVQARERLLFRRIYSTSQVLMVMLDAHALILECNPMFTRKFGYTSQELAHKSFIRTLVPEIFRTAFREDLDACLNLPDGGSCLSAVLSRSGDVCHVEWEIILQRDDFGMLETVLLVGQDVTRELIAQSALERSEKLFAALASVSPVGIFQADMEGDLTYVNERWCQIAGIEQDEALGHGWTHALHSDDRQAVMDAWDRARLENVPFHMEHRFQRKDGMITWVLSESVAERNEENDPVGFVGTITDITSRIEAEQSLRRAYELMENRVRERTAELEHTNTRLQMEIMERIKIEQALRESRNTLKVFIDGLPYPAALINTDGSALAWNQAAIQEMGSGPEDLNYRMQNGLLPVEILNGRRQHSRRVIDTRKPLRYEEEYESRIRDVTILPVMGDGDVVEKIVIITRDITHERAQEQELVCKNDELRDAKERYRLIFEFSPVANWELDASELAREFDHLYYDLKIKITDYPAYFAEHPEKVGEFLLLLRVTTWNRRAKELFEIDEDLIAPAHVTAFFDKESLLYFQEAMLALALEQREYENELDVTNHAGHTRRLLVRITIMPGSQRSFERLVVTFVER